MKIVFLGTPDFALPSLDYLAKSHNVVGVVTQPDRERDRGKVTFCPVKQRALELNLQVFQFEKIRKEGVDILKELNPDVMITCAYGQIISQEILDIPKFGVLNVHGSLLPKYRGSSPIQWAIINGEKQTGITIMKTALGIDSGDILLQKVVDILPKETAGQLFDRLAIEGAITLAEALQTLEIGEAIFKPQDHTLATHFPMLTKTSGKVDWTKSAQAISQLVLGLNPWPIAYSFLNGKMLKFWDVDVARVEDLTSCVSNKTSKNDKENSAKNISIEGYDKKLSLKCGEAFIDKGRLFVGCGTDCLIINEIQLEGKKRMATKDFLLGYNHANGFVLE